MHIKAEPRLTNTSTVLDLTFSGKSLEYNCLVLRIMPDNTVTIRVMMRMRAWKSLDFLLTKNSRTGPTVLIPTIQLLSLIMKRTLMNVMERKVLLLITMTVTMLVKMLLKAMG